jgi:hypothetical protein
MSGAVPVKRPGTEGREPDASGRRGYRDHHRERLRLIGLAECEIASAPTMD